MHVDRCVTLKGGGWCRTHNQRIENCEFLKRFFNIDETEINVNVFLASGGAKEGGPVDHNEEG